MNDLAEQPAPQSAPTPQITDTQLSGLFQGVDKFDAALPAQAKANLTPLLEHSFDPNAQRQRTANQLFLARRYGKPISDVVSNYEAYRGDYAKKAYGKDQIDDGGFYSAAGAQLKKEGEQRTMFAEMSKALYSHVMSGAAPTDFAKDYLPTIQKNPAFDKSHLDLYYQAVHDQTKQYEDFSTAHHEAVDAVKNYLSLASTEEAGDTKKLPDHSQLDPLREAASRALAGLSPQDQDLVLALGSKGVKSKEENPFQKTVGRMARGGEQTVKSALGFIREFSPIAGSFEQYAAEAPSRLAQKKLDDVFHGKVDPMTANSWAGKTALNTAEGLPRIAAMFTGPGLALNFAAAQNELQQSYEAKGISTAKSAGLAVTAAGAQTALQFVTGSMVMGKVPGLQNWISGMTSRAAKLAALGSVETATIGTSTAAQTAAPDLVQDLAASFDHSLPKVSKDELWQHLKDSAPETALQLVPLVLIGTGAGAFKSGAFAREYLTPDRMAAAGHPKETIDQVMAEPTALGKAEILEKEHGAREFGSVYQKSALANLDAQKTPLGQLPPNHIPVTIQAEDGTTYQAAMNGYYDPEKPSIGRMTDAGWSHGLLKENEKIVSQVPTMDEWASGIRSLSRNENVSTGTGVETSHEAKLIADWKEQIAKEADGTYSISSPSGERIAEVNTPEMAAKVLADQGQASPAQQMALDLADLPDGKNTTLSDYAKGGSALGIADQTSAKVYGWLRDAYHTGGEVGSFLRNVPKLEGFKKIVNSWMGGRQMSAIRMVPFLKEIRRIAPNKITREGIANWIDAGGDAGKLEAAAAASKMLPIKKGYEAALKLKPAEVELAKRLSTWFDQQFERAKQAGIMGDEDFRQNYVTQMIERPFVGGGVKSEFYGKLSQNFKYSEERTFPNFHELEQAGFNVQTKDIGAIAAQYEASLTKAIETRKMLNALMGNATEHGEPLAYRGQAPEGVESDYAMVDHPSLKGVKFHPDIADHLKNILGRSAITEWYEQPGSPGLQLGKRFVKFVDEANRTFANTMLSGISTFHAVHEAKRAAGNRINVFNLEKITPEDPRVEQSVREGLILASPNSALSEFTEGLGGHVSLTDHVPGLGQASKAVADFTFNKLIPQIKFTAWLKMRERNLASFKEEIAAGKISEADVGYLTAQQVNARFGHLNNADLGKNPTMQHFARMFLLAPDFFESNIRNYGQVLAGLTGSKTGAQPLQALALTGMVTWLAARVINSAVNDDHDPHFEEPFGVVHDNRVYTMRSETEDLWRMAKNTRGYISGRLSPTFGTMIDALTGKNWRGEKQSFADAMRDYAVKMVPLSLRWVPGVSGVVDKISPTERTKTVSLWQEFLGSQGIQVARKSDVTNAYKLAGEWKKDQGIKEDTGTYPVSRYQGVRYALEDQDKDRLHEEIKKLAPKDEADFKKLAKGAEESLLHAWTGNEKSDEKFFQSLSQKDQHKVLTAQFKREAELGDFLRALEAYAKEMKINFHASEKKPKPSRDPYKSFRN